MHEMYIKKAIELATQNVTQHKGGPFGAIVVKNNTIIASGTNQVTTSQDPTAHAEIVAIRAACKALNNFQLTDCIIYSSCEPCPMCLGALYWARPKALYFASSRHDAAQVGFDDSFIYDQLQQSYDKRSILTEQLAVDDHLVPFLTWHKNTEKIEY